MSNTARNAALGLLLGVTAAISAPADDGSGLWLRTPIPAQNAYHMDTDKPISATMNIVLSELSRFRQRNWAVATDKHRNDLGNEGFEIRIMNDMVKIHAQTDIGLLYGAYHLLREQACGSQITDNYYVKEVPYYKFRMLNHWDNLDGTVERGYAGNSI